MSKEKTCMALKFDSNGLLYVDIQFSSRIMGFFIKLLRHREDKAFIIPSWGCGNLSSENEWRIVWQDEIEKPSPNLKVHGILFNENDWFRFHFYQRHEREKAYVEKIEEKHAVPGGSTVRESFHLPDEDFLRDRRDYLSVISYEDLEKCKFEDFINRLHSGVVEIYFEKRPK